MITAFLIICRHKCYRQRRTCTVRREDQFSFQWRPNYITFFSQTNLPNLTYSQAFSISQLEVEGHHVSHEEILVQKTVLKQPVHIHETYDFLPLFSIYETNSCIFIFICKHFLSDVYMFKVLYPMFPIFREFFFLLLP